MKSLGSNENTSYRAMIYIICQFLIQGIGFILAPIYTRLLSTADYGLASVFITSVSFVSIFIGLQTHGSFNNFNISFSSDEKNAYKSSMLTLSLCSMVVVQVVCWLFADIFAQLLHLPCLLIMLLPLASFGSYCITFMGAFYTANKQSNAYLVQSVSISLAIAALSIGLILILPSDKYFGKIFGYSIIYILGGTGMFLAAMFKGKTLYHAEYWKFCLPLTAPLVFHAIAGQILAQSDRLMLNSMAGSAIAGIYSFSYSLAVPINAIWIAFNSAWVPQYYTYMKTGEYHVMHRQMCRYRTMYTGLTMGFMLVSAELVKIIAPPSYSEGLYLVPIIALSYYLNFLYGFPSNYEFYCKKTQYISLASTVAAIANVMLNLLLIPKFGMTGAALATLVSYILLFVFHEYVARYIIKGYNLSPRFYLKGLLPVIFIFAASYLLMDFWLIRWLMAVILGLDLLRRLIKHKGIF